MYLPLKKCPYCLMILTDDPRNHLRWCEKNPKSKKIKLDQYDWPKIQKLHDSGLNFTDIATDLGIEQRVMRTALKYKKIHSSHKPVFKMSKEAKDRASVRLKNLRKNGVGNLTHKKSKPCEHLKTLLVERGIRFTEEFLPLSDRLFRIDIAFPNEKIGIEINGNQHYETNGTLKKYYQERHDLIEKSGWKLFELHYSVVYNRAVIFDIIEIITRTVGRMDIAPAS